jgi:hypothetical protein
MCQDRDVLTHRYDAELRVYADAVRSLKSAIGPDFPEASKRVGRALLAFENARDQISEHIRSHHCDAPATT